LTKKGMTLRKRWKLGGSGEKRKATPDGKGPTGENRLIFHVCRTVKDPRGGRTIVGKLRGKSLKGKGGSKQNIFERKGPGMGGNK